jgi:curved DNA-binding protein CbpA
LQQDVAALYAALGLPVGASLEQIEQAHRDPVKVWHPDRFARDSRLQRKAEEKLKEINAAHDALRSAFARMRDRPPCSATITFPDRVASRKNVTSSHE